MVLIRAKGYVYRTHNFFLGTFTFLHDVVDDTTRMRHLRRVTVIVRLADVTAAALVVVDLLDVYVAPTSRRQSLLLPFLLLLLSAPT